MSLAFACACMGAPISVFAGPVSSNQAWVTPGFGAGPGVTILSEGPGQAFHAIVDLTDPLVAPDTTALSTFVHLLSVEPLSSYEVSILTVPENVGFYDGFLGITAPLPFQADVGQVGLLPPFNFPGQETDVIANMRGFTDDPAGVPPGTNFLFVAQYGVATLPQIGDTWFLFANVGDFFGWTDPTGAAPLVQFGDNDPIIASPGATAPNPVVIIEYVPEPGTLTLLALGGGLVMMRRRR